VDKAHERNAAQVAGPCSLIRDLCPELGALEPASSWPHEVGEASTELRAGTESRHHRAPTRPPCAWEEPP